MKNDGQRQLVNIILCFKHITATSLQYIPNLWSEFFFGRKWQKQL